MTAPVVRRLRLPAAQSSPAVARAAVHEALLEVDLAIVIDEAMLLTTELVTNGVIHAGTDLEIEIVATPDAISVMVLDYHCGPLSLTGWDATTPGVAGPGALHERGRGLLLVDRLADRWGTLHHSGGKGIWFRLKRPGLGPRRRHLPELTSAPGAIPPANAFAELAAVRPPIGTVMLAGSGSSNDSPLATMGNQELRRLCEAVHTDTAAIKIDIADGGGMRAIASYGPQPASGSGVVRISLGLSKPWAGELVLSAPGTSYARPLAQLTADRLTLLVENYRLRKVDNERRALLTFLAEAGELLAHSLDVDLTLALIPRLVVPRLGQWCAVHTVSSDTKLHLASSAHMDEECLPDLAETLNQSIEHLSDVLNTDGAIALAAPIDGYAVPLTARGHKLGTLTVGQFTCQWQRTEEIAVVEDLARRVALAIDNARIHADRQEIARELQRSLVPPQLPTIDGIDLGAEYVPSHEGIDVGGDFYDIITLSPHRWLIVIGDISGKGVRVAATTGLVRDVIRTLARDGRTIPEILVRLAEAMAENDSSRFCTLAMASVSRKPNATLDIDLYLAGHDQPILVSANGTATFVGHHGTALGLLSTTHSSHHEHICLAHRQALVFYTDGVTERQRDSEFFGRDRLLHAAASLSSFSAHVMAARLRSAVVAFSSEVPRDDIAILILRNEANL